MTESGIAETLRLLGEWDGTLWDKGALREPEIVLFRIRERDIRHRRRSAARTTGEDSRT